MRGAARSGGDEGPADVAGGGPAVRTPRRERVSPLEMQQRWARGEGAHAQPAEAARPGTRPAEAARPGTRPAEAARPGTRPAEAARPGTRPAKAARPGTRPAEAARPGTQPAVRMHGNSNGRLVPHTG